MNINPTPWNGPDIVVNPKFTKGDHVETVGNKFGVVHSCEKRVDKHKVFLYRVELYRGGSALFYENELQLNV